MRNVQRLYISLSLPLCLLVRPMNAVLYLAYDVSPTVTPLLMLLEALLVDCYCGLYKFVDTPLNGAPDELSKEFAVGDSLA